MSCEGTAIGNPLAGSSMFCVESMRTRASACASGLRGTCTAIWSPSKSALKAEQTSGWTWMALPSTSTGSNAWMPRRWSVGARLRNTGCSLMTSSRTSATPVIEEGVDGLLEHPLLVVHDHVGSAEVEQATKPVVPVYDPAVEVVQIRGGETAAVELDHRAEVRREHGDGLHDHPLGAIAAHAEGVDDLEAFDRLLALLSSGGGNDVPEVLGLVLEVDLSYEVPYGLGAHPAAEVYPVAVLVSETVLHLAEELLVVHDLARLQRLELLPGAPDEPYLLGNRAAYVRDGLLGLLVYLRYGGLSLVLGYVRVLLGQLVRRALALDHALALGPKGLDLVDLLVPVQLELPYLILHPATQQVYVVGPLLTVDPRNDGAGEVEYPVELLRTDIEQISHSARHALDEPHVRHRGGELDVAHPVAAYAGAGYLDPAPLADDALEPDPLVLAAVALPVLGRAEDALVEEAVLLRT